MSDAFDEVEAAALDVEAVHSEETLLEVETEGSDALGSAIEESWAGYDDFEVVGDAELGDTLDGYPDPNEGNPARAAFYENQ